MTTEKVTQDFPQIVALERLLGLPLIEFALNKSAATYVWMKNSNLLAHWALVTAEMSLNVATKQAMIPIAAPIARKFERHIHLVDNTLCRGLDKIEKMVPLVKESPRQIMSEAYIYVTQSTNQMVSNISVVYCIIIEQVEKWRDICWEKANKILNTHYGSEFVKRIDSSADCIDKLIEKYFPIKESDEENKIVVTQADEDKLLHILQAIGNLSAKATRHIYRYLIALLNDLKDKATNELKPYIARIVEFLYCTRCLKKSKKTQTPSDEQENGELRKEEANEEEKSEEPRDEQTDMEKKEN